jgi:hypothetical protein
LKTLTLLGSGSGGLSELREVGLNDDMVAYGLLRVVRHRHMAPDNISFLLPLVLASVPWLLTKHVFNSRFISFHKLDLSIRAYVSSALIADDFLALV